VGIVKVLVTRPVNSRILTVLSVIVVLLDPALVLFHAPKSHPVPVDVLLIIKIDKVTVFPAND
jgi:hypothetical protein